MTEGHRTPAECAACEEQVARLMRHMEQMIRALALAEQAAPTNLHRLAFEAARCGDPLAGQMIDAAAALRRTEGS